MENASKALIIAGGFLVTILFLTLVSYIFTYMKGYTSKKSDEIQSNQIKEYNQQFLNYAGRKDLKIQDVITIVNLARNNNMNQNRPTKIDVLVDNEVWSDLKEDDLIKKLQDSISAGVQEYECSRWGIIVNENTQYVEKVKIHRK